MCGPGNLHLINGLFDCQRTRTPVLAIAAHIPSAEIGSNYFQETHPQELFRECSVYCEMVSSAAQLPFVLETAIRAAVGQRGVAVIVIPGDVALQAAPEARHLAEPRPAARPPRQLSRRRRPRDAGVHAQRREKSHLVLRPRLRRRASAADEAGDALKAPIVHALGGKEHVEYDNPYDVGMTGLIGFSSGYAAMLGCDMLLMLGTDFPYKQFFPEKAKIAQIDIRPENLGRRTRIDLGLVGDVAATIEALLPKLRRRPTPSTSTPA